VKVETEIADESQDSYKVGELENRPNHESKNTEPQGTQASATSVYVLRGLQESVDNVRVTRMDIEYPLHLIDLLAILYSKGVAETL